MSFIFVTSNDLTKLVTDVSTVKSVCRSMPCLNKKKNPVARQLRHFKQKVIKNKKAYDRKKKKI